MGPGVRSRAWGPVAACQPFNKEVTSRQFVFGAARHAQFRCEAMWENRGEKFDCMGASAWPSTVHLSAGELCSLNFKIGG